MYGINVKLYETGEAFDWCFLCGLWMTASTRLLVVGLLSTVSGTDDSVLNHKSTQHNSKLGETKKSSVNSDLPPLHNTHIQQHTVTSIFIYHDGSVDYYTHQNHRSANRCVEIV